MGLEERREAKEGMMELGDEMEDGMVGGRIGIGLREISMTGSMGLEVTISRYLSLLYGDRDLKMGSEVTISRYLSLLYGDRDLKMGVNTGRSILGWRRVRYMWKPCK